MDMKYESWERIARKSVNVDPDKNDNVTASW